MTFLILLWIPFSWLLHAFIHENAHARKARAYGFTTTINLFPRKINNRWVYASFTFARSTPSTPGERRGIFFAPFLVELIWFMFWGVVTLGSQNAIYEAIFALETIITSIDLSVWLLSLIRHRQGTDGQMWWSAIDPEGKNKLNARVVGAGVLLVIISCSTLLFFLKLLPFYLQ